MENNELMMNEEIEVMNDEFVADGKSGVGTIVAMAIGAGIASACVVGAKLVKKGVAAWKAKKELRKPDKEIVVEAEEIEAVVEAEE